MQCSLDGFSALALFLLCYISFRDLIFYESFLSFITKKLLGTRISYPPLDLSHRFWIIFWFLS